MSDIFQEVEEDVRRERYEQIWKKYGNYIIAAAAVVVLAVAGYQAWQRYDLSQRQQVSDRLRQASQAVQTGNRAGAVPGLESRGAIGYQGGGADPVSRFRDELSAAGGVFYQVETSEAACKQILNIVRAKEARQILLGHGVVLDELNLAGKLRGAGGRVVPMSSLSSDDSREEFFAADLGISEDSVRRDLRDLAAAGLCQRVYGGAVPVSPALADYATRTSVEPGSKQRVAAAAAALIQSGDRVILDGGTTTLAVVRALSPTLSATVITHSRPGDLVVFLTAPSNFTVTLSSANGITATNAFAGTVWDDRAARSDRYSPLA